jgi:hypothetical protein
VRHEHDVAGLLRALQHVRILIFADDIRGVRIVHVVSGIRVSVIRVCVIRAVTVVVVDEGLRPCSHLFRLTRGFKRQLTWSLQWK